MSLQSAPPESPPPFVPSNPPIHQDALFTIYRADDGALIACRPRDGRAVEGLGLDLVIQRLASTLWSGSQKAFEVASTDARCFVFTRQRVGWCIEELRCDPGGRTHLRRCSASDHAAILTALVTEIERPAAHAARIEVVAHG